MKASWAKVSASEHLFIVYVAGSPCVAWLALRCGSWDGKWGLFAGRWQWLEVQHLSDDLALLFQLNLQNNQILKREVLLVASDEAVHHIMHFDPEDQNYLYVMTMHQVCELSKPIFAMVIWLQCLNYWNVAKRGRNHNIHYTLNCRYCCYWWPYRHLLLAKKQAGHCYYLLAGVHWPGQCCWCNGIHFCTCC